MINKLINKYPELECCKSDLEKAVEILKNCYNKGGKLLICGNGGSSADSSHITGELMKGFLLKRKLPETVKKKFADLFGESGLYIANNLQGALPAISLPDQTAILTAFNNDVDADLGYAQLVYGYGKTQDVLLCLSTSGNSKNVINAAKAAAIKGIKVISMVGESKCLLDDLSHVSIHAPRPDTASVQELHLPIYHAICAELEKYFFE